MSRLAIRWLLLAAALNVAWEVGQLHLYTIYAEGSLPDLAYAVAHCTAGDVLIALCSYLVAAMLTRSWRWPVEHPLAGLAAAALAGAAYTVFSEWLNVYVRNSWAYTDAMPLVFGIGLAPLLQWIVLPAIQLLVLRLFDEDQTAFGRSG